MGNEIIMNQENLFQITAPYFCAGIVVINGNVIAAAPILNWAIGKSTNDLFCYFQQKRWKITKCQNL